MRKERCKLIKIKIVSFFSVDHNDIFDHKYCIDPGGVGGGCTLIFSHIRRLDPMFLVQNSEFQ